MLKDSYMCTDEQIVVVVMDLINFRNGVLYDGFITWHNGDTSIANHVGAIPEGYELYMVERKS